MNRYGIEIAVKNAPKLDPEFMPILKFNRSFLNTAKSRSPSPWSGPTARWPPATPISTARRRWPRPTTTTSTGWSRPSCG